MSTSASTYNVRSKPSDGSLQKSGPIKATIPMSSFLRPLNNGGSGGGRGSRASASSDDSSNTLSTNLFAALSPPMRHISPDHQNCGHRSPCATNYYKSCKVVATDKSTLSSSIRRTASLDALYMRPSWNMAHHLQMQQQLQSQQQVATYTILQLDKATQTDGTYLDDYTGTIGDNNILLNVTDMSGGGGLNHGDFKIGKVMRERLQNVSMRTTTTTTTTTTSTATGDGSDGEHSVSSQTLIPLHVKASPVTIPPRPYPAQMKPMRNSVEGLNQEIEKLVLVPGQPHTCRPESNLFARGIPEGHRAPLADILHDTRSVNTQTPNRDLLSSDGSQSTSPEEGAELTVAGSSNRINRFLAREPPDGCEKVCMKLTDADQLQQQQLQPSAVYKPTGFKLIPSRGSAFQPLQPIALTAAISPATSTIITALPSSEDETN